MARGKVNFQRRHYEFIARVVNDITKSTYVDEDASHLITVKFVNALQETNPNFDRDRFIKACVGD